MNPKSVPAKYPARFCMMLVEAHNSTAFIYAKEASCPNISTYIDLITNSFIFFLLIPVWGIAFFKNTTLLTNISKSS